MVKKITIKDYKAQGLIETLAKKLSLDIEREDREFCVSLSSGYGRGYVKGFDFDYGISAYEFDCTLEKGLQCIFRKEIVQPLIILFNRGEAITHAFKDHTQNVIHHLESLIACGGTAHENILELQPQQSTCFFALVINRKSFEEKINDFLASMDTCLESIFKDVNGVNTFYSQSHYTLDIAKFIEEFTTTDLTGLIRHVFLEGKAYEILTHFLKQYLEYIEEPEGKKILRQSTVEKIEQATSLIQKEMESVGSILSIAKRVGLNQNTLQEGFKKLYKKSVNQYIKEVRLDQAKALMENTELNITEITYRIGINSRSYFSKLFKEQFGISPKEYLNQRRKKDNTTLTA